MKQYYSQQSARKHFIFLLFLLCLVSCTKSYITDVLFEQKELLSGNSLKLTKWKLAETIIDHTAQNGSSAAYEQQYFPNGSFADNQDCKGNWNMLSADSIMVSYLNFYSGVRVTQGYRIENLTTDQLTLTYTSNGEKIQLSYVAVK